MLNCVRQKINRAALVLGLLAGLAGCQSQAPDSGNFHYPPAAGQNPAGATTTTAAAPAQDNSPSMLLREGDTVNISFPGAPTLDNRQVIRRDGKITLDMVGEMKAVGLTPRELEQQLLKAYDNQLVVKQVSVKVESSTFTVFVTGAVMRSGKITSDHVETPLEAVIEAGVDYTKANLKKVAVIRENPNGKSDRFILNLKDVLKARPTEPFTLKSMDKIYVPERMTWF
jgi:polysaccharide export outer membrane protein